MTLLTHEDYFATMPAETRARLEAIQAEVERRVPDAQHCIGYRIPAFRKGRIFFYFAGFKKHIGIFPPVRDPALVEETARWRGPKGNLSFPLSEPLPLDLIGRLAQALAGEHGQ